MSDFNFIIVPLLSLSRSNFLSLNSKIHISFWIPSTISLKHIFIFQQEMRVCRKTIYRIARWALSSMPSMPWLTAFTTCTRSCARANRAFVRPWILLMVVSFWTTCSRHPSEESLGRRSILIRMETPQAGKNKNGAFVTSSTVNFSCGPSSPAH